MNAHRDRARRRTIRSIVTRLEQHLRLQRELLWHPRLGLAGSRQPAPIRVSVDRRLSRTLR